MDTHTRLAITDDFSIFYEAIVTAFPLVEIPNLVSLMDPSLPFDKLHGPSLAAFDLVFKIDADTKTVPYTWVYSYDRNSEILSVSFPDNLGTAADSPNLFRVQAEQFFGEEVTTPRSWKARKSWSVLEFTLWFRWKRKSSTALYEGTNTQISFHPYREPPIGGQMLDTLEQQNTFVAGRYGSWDYLWTVESARSG